MRLDITTVLHMAQLMGKADFKIFPLNLPSLISSWVVYDSCMCTLI